MRNKHDTQPGPGDIIETEDGFRFAVLEDGSITDGDMAWESVEQFRAAMADDAQGPIGWEIKHRDTVTQLGQRRHSRAVREESGHG